MLDDFYEPSEFDRQVEEFKDSLRGAVKKEYTDRIESLERQLAELRELKADWNARVAELEKAKREAETAKREAERNAKRMRLAELVEDRMVNAYGIARRREYVHPKCDKCDENGKIHYKSPRGRECTEECECREQKFYYSVEVAKVARFSMYNGNMNFVYKYRKLDRYDDVEDEFVETRNVYDKKPFDKINTYYGMIFLDKERAQAFCDYLNKKGE